MGICPPGGAEAVLPGGASPAGRAAFFQKRHAEAADVYRRVIAQDSYLEAAHRRLMRCYALLGERSRARKDGRAGVGGGIKEWSYDEPRRNRRLRQGASRKRLNRDTPLPDTRGDAEPDREFDRSVGTIGSRD